MPTSALRHRVVSYTHGVRYAAALVAFFCLIVGVSAQNARGFDEAGRTALSDALKGAVERGDVPAVVGVVVTPNAEIFKAAYGRAATGQNMPLAPDAIFRVHSLTKPVTSVAAMILVQEKRLQLDDPIDKYLGAPATPRVVATFSEVTGLISTSSPGAPVTVRQLLTHTSGIAYAFSNDVMHRIEQSAPRIAETDVLVHEPGERWTYGPSTKLLGDVVEKVSGQTLDAFMASRIFAPLGMVDTAFSVPDEKTSRVVTIHQRQEGKLVETANPAAFPGTVRGDTGLFSTAADYGRFVRMLLNGGELEGKRVLDAATVRAMKTNQIGSLTVEEQPAFNPLLSLPFPSGAGRDGFGFGFQIARPEKPDKLRRSAGSLSWSGVMNAHFWADPERRVGAVLLMQVLPFNDERCLALWNTFEEQVYTHLR